MKKVSKDMLVTYEKNQLRLAIMENGDVAEVYMEKKERRSIVGNIYKGRITNVLPGMSAAFIDIGTGKNALLYLQDLVLMEDGSKIRPRRIGKALKQNDEIVVQVVKDPMQGKGARLTTYLSLPGRLMVYMPQSTKNGVSRKLSDRERERLRRLARQVRPEEGSTVIRTAARKARKKDLEMDLKYLVSEWEKTQSKTKKARAPEIIYKEPDLALRVIRDNLSRDYRKVLVDDKNHHRKIKEYVSMVMPELGDKIQLYRGKDPMFTKFGVEKGIEAALRRKVSLPSGGYIVIDEAEALTAIDVNTGSYTGKHSLEDTVLKTNLEAIVEVVRQLRLRDIGGIIVIDFIDMEKKQNQDKVLETLEAELEKDRTKTQVVTLSRLGLVEMTRKNVTEGLIGTLGKTCPKCEGRGRIFS
ncbi:MAG: Rne/Rng family ribonuclease [Actinobacteria bacterium]|nr:Rne/Rng family ribonuclease [Actinomycetota bacterium]